MSKINIKTVLENKTTNEIHEYDLQAIKNNNKINYLENDINVSIIFDNNIEIIRKNSINEIVFKFIKNKNTKCLYKIYNNTYELNLYTNNIIIKDNYIEIDYTIEKDNLNFKLYIK